MQGIMYRSTAVLPVLVICQYSVSIRVLKDVYAPYGPLMCRELQRYMNSTVTFTQKDLLCRRIPPACLKKDNDFQNVSSMKDISKQRKQEPNGQGPNLKTDGIISGGQCKLHVNLYQICEMGNLQQVKNILNQGLEDINCRGYMGQTPVMAAAGSGQMEVFNFLVSQCCDLSVVDNKGANALTLACRSGSEDIVRKLIDELRFDVNGFERNGWSPVMTAVYYGHSRVFNILVSRGCNLSDVFDSKNILHLACLGGNLNIVNYILTNFTSDLECKGKNEETPVMFAIFSGNLALVRFLVSRGCNPKAVDANGYTILHHACVQGYAKIAKYILSEKLVVCESRDIGGRTSVLLAAYFGHLTVFDTLVVRGCNISAVDYNNSTILHMACLSARLEMVEHILSRSIVGIESKEVNGRSPLLTAVYKGHTQVTELLMSKGCDVKVLDLMGRNILHTGVHGGHLEMVKFILSKEIISLESADNYGKTPVMIAAYLGHIEIAEVLKDQGSDLKAVDNDGNNMFHLACKGGHVHMVKYLLSLGIFDKERRGQLRRTPLMLASESGKRAVVVLLLDEGCNTRARDDEGNTMWHLACQRGKGHFRLVEFLIKSRMMKNTDVNKRGQTPLQVAIETGNKRVIALLEAKQHISVK